MAPDRYTKTAITLHWVIAFLIIAQLGTGIVFGYRLADKSILFPLMQFHKSLGLTILVLSIVRLLWRFTHKAPPLPDHMPIWEKLAAKASHYAFYIFMIGIPLSGWILVSTSSMGFPTSYFNLFIWPHIPGLETLAEDQKHLINEASETFHVYMAYSMLALLFMHIGAALKHQFIDKDNVMHHMIPLVKPRLPKLPLAILLLSLVPFSAQAANWTVDKEKSVIGFSGENSGEKFSGKFEEWDAVINFDPAKPETSSVKVTIKTASAKTGTATYDSTLPKGEWFNIEKMPEAVFESSSIKSLGDNKYESDGTLTIKGISQKIKLPFALTIKDKHALMTSETTLDRLLYDIGKSSDPKGEWVSKDIAVSIRVEAQEK